MLFLSTYELGRQPTSLLGPASVAAALGHESRLRDLSVEPLTPHDLDWADAVVISVPMHTALRLALQLVADIRQRRPQLPLALVGLYAGAAAGLADGEASAATRTVMFGHRDLLAAGEVEQPVADWLTALEQAATGEPSEVPGGPIIVSDIGPPSRVEKPPRDAELRLQLPPIDRYARLSHDGREKVSASVEVTSGCSHKCRHCPVPVVYAGRTRARRDDDVLVDIDVAVAGGAEHISFSDPDFMNRPALSRRIVRAMHSAWPHLTFDATVKVEHILRYEDLWDEMAGAGCLFVVSAFESIDDRVLEALAKGHTRAGIEEALRILREVAVEVRPSLLPFTPWTTRRSVVELIEFVAAHDLVWNIDPVQYGIRLLLPPGSLLLDDPDPVLAASLGSYSPQACSWAWRSPDPAVDRLQEEIAAITEEATDSAEEIAVTFGRVAAAAGATPHMRSISSIAGPDRPRLTEAWFCCAEPTTRQLSLLSSARTVT